MMEGSFSAEVQSFIITLKGKTSHAAEPQQGINPALCMAELIGAYDKLNVHDPEESDFAVLTPVHVLMGDVSYGISPGEGALHYTMRTWSTEAMDKLKAEITQLMEGHSQKHNLTPEISWLEYFPASENDPESNSHVKQAALKNAYNIVDRPYPFKFGEDFGWYGRRYRSAMFGLGAGLDTAPLHSADYDFPDALIATGHAMFRTVIRGVLK